MPLLLLTPPMLLTHMLLCAGLSKSTFVHDIFQTTVADLLNLQPSAVKVHAVRPMLRNAAPVGCEIDFTVSTAELASQQGTLDMLRTAVKDGSLMRQLVTAGLPGAAGAGPITLVPVAALDALWGISDPPLATSSSSSDSSSSAGVAAGVVVCVVVVAAVACMYFWWARQRRRRQEGGDRKLRVVDPEEDGPVYQSDDPDEDAAVQAAADASASPDSRFPGLQEFTSSEVEIGIAAAGSKTLAHGR